MKGIGLAGLKAGPSREPFVCFGQREAEAAMASGRHDTIGGGASASGNRLKRWSKMCNTQRYLSLPVWYWQSRHAPSRHS